jgi:class 3 adenylate cyclase
MAKMVNVGEELLESRLEMLESARTWSPRVVSRLENLIRSGDDGALFRINPIKFAHQHHLAEAEAIDLFLHATSVGLFIMDWMVLCPMCSAIVESFGSLRTIATNHYHCHFCQNDYEATLDDYIVIAFTIGPTIRRISFHAPDTLPPLEYLANFAFSGRHLACNVTQGSSCLSPQQILDHCVHGLGFLEPQEVATIEFVAGRTLAPGKGVINGTEVVSGEHFLVPISERQSSEPQRLTVAFADRRWETFGAKVVCGPVVLDVKNASDHRLFFTVTEFPDALPHCCTMLEFEPYLSAKHLLTTQTFRDLFRNEVVKGVEGMGVRDITLMFTDLKGSTELYERIGDLNAFALVQEHFERLAAAAVAHRGAIIKTLGDAVMAAFMTPLDAVKAALAMQDEIGRFNDARGDRDLILKIGLHRGATIAVTLNERLDYFGQNVNIAARVEGLAEGGEICLTPQVRGAVGVDAILEPYDVSVASARLKGVQQIMPVWRVRVNPEKTMPSMPRIVQQGIASAV